MNSWLQAYATLSIVILRCISDLLYPEIGIPCLDPREEKDSQIHYSAHRETTDLEKVGFEKIFRSIKKWAKTGTELWISKTPNLNQPGPKLDEFWIMELKSTKTE